MALTTRRLVGLHSRFAFARLDNGLQFEDGGQTGGIVTNLIFDPRLWAVDLDIFFKEDLLHTTSLVREDPANLEELLLFIINAVCQHSFTQSTT